MTSLYQNVRYVTYTNNFVPGGGGTIASERGSGGVPLPTRGHTLWYTLYMYFVDGYQLQGVSNQCWNLEQSMVAKNRIGL